MSERHSGHDVSAVVLAAAGSGGTIEVEIPIPTATRRWSILVNPIDSGPATAPSGVVQYSMRGDFEGRNPGGAAITFGLNTVEVITSEDVVPRVKIVFTLGADPQPDGGLRIDLNIVR